MNGRELLEGMSFVHSKYVQEAEGALPKQERTVRFPGKKVLLIAAIVGLTVFLMGSAIHALVKMNVNDVKVIVPDLSATAGNQTDVEETQAYVVLEGEKVDFDVVQDVYIELGSYYPQSIPEGYELTFVSDTAYQQQTIRYEDADGRTIRFTINLPHEAAGTEIYDIIQKSDVLINGNAGILYEQSGGRHTVVWTDAKQGFGFELYASDGNVDVLTMARSTAEGEPLTPSRANKTVEAIAELGNFSPSDLPDGFEEENVMGSPIADGGGWYSYVRKWYVNKAENTRIYFEYETYRIVTEDGYIDDARTVCSFFIPGYYILENIVVGEEVEINGMFGIATGNHIAWADPVTHRVFHLTSEDVLDEELLKVAQSVTEHE